MRLYQTLHHCVRRESDLRCFLTRLGGTLENAECWENIVLDVLCVSGTMAFVFFIGGVCFLVGGVNGQSMGSDQGGGIQFY